MRGIILEHLTWPRAAEALREHRTVVLPVGARLKEHGFHLPLNNDFTLAEYLAERVVQVAPVVVLPTLPYGYYPAFVEYAGSVNIGVETFTETVVDICRSIHRHGGNRFYILNTGISTCKGLESARQTLAVEDVVMEYTELDVALHDVLQEVQEQARGSHADEIETSMMMVIAPDTVDMEKATPDLHERKGPGPFTRDALAKTGLYSGTGAWGDPTLATEEKGKKLIDALVAHVLNTLVELGSTSYTPAPPRTQYLDGQRGR